VSVSFFASILLSITTGVFLIRIFLPEHNGNRIGLPLMIFLGAGIGAGLSSCVYFLCMITKLTMFVLLIDTLLCVVTGAVSFFRQKPAWHVRGGKAPASRRNEKKTGLEKLLMAVFSVEAVASIAAFIFAFLKEPHGRWDAWLIWNMHARFLARSGEAWREVFSLPMDWSHWDYPLLLPLSIVRGWKYAGAEEIYVPAAFAFFFAVLTAGLLLFSVSSLRNSPGGLLAAMILLGTPFFILMGISQFADVPFSFFILATIVLLFLPERLKSKSPGPLILAGISAALCAWTKNEGLLFFLVVAIVIAAAGAFERGWKKAAARCGWFLAGALPVMLIVLYFKIELAPANDLTAGFSVGRAAWAKLTDLSRYAMIAKAFFITGLSFTQGPVDLRVGIMKFSPGLVNMLLPVAWFFFMGANRDRQNRDGVISTTAILVLMLSGYFFVYLLTPLPLDYHIATSLNRLFLQLWPSIIFLFFIISNAPDVNWGAKMKKPPFSPKRARAKARNGRNSASFALAAKRDLCSIEKGSRALMNPFFKALNF
jgi:hypothetical protein